MEFYSSIVRKNSKKRPKIFVILISIVPMMRAKWRHGSVFPVLWPEETFCRQLPTTVSTKRAEIVSKLRHLTQLVFSFGELAHNPLHKNDSEKTHPSI